jgi:hypothetical protein
MQKYFRSGHCYFTQGDRHKKLLGRQVFITDYDLYQEDFVYLPHGDATYQMTLLLAMWLWSRRFF